MNLSRSHIRKIILESMIQMENISQDSVSVDGFDFKTTLEPSIWTSDEYLNDDIKESLLKIVKSFLSSLSIDTKEEDIVLTGSLANYNWSKYSDVDLHIQVDFSSIDEDYDLVKGYFDSASALWNLRHDIKIKEYDVEIYVENSGEEHISTGLYSILNSEWIKKPEEDQDEKIDIKAVKKRAASIMNQILELEKLDEDSERMIGMAEKVKAKIRRMRKSGLKTKKGQYSTGNIAFKVLRRNGSLQRLSDIKTTAYDNSMSIRESDYRDIIKSLTLAEKKTHIVKPGENPSTIALLHKITVHELLKKNEIDNPTTIQIGQVLTIPDPVEKLNSHLTPSTELKDWMKYEEGKMNSLGKGNGKPHTKSYNDGTGRLTIGYGRNQNRQEKQEISEEQANGFLKDDLKAAAKPLQASTAIDLPTTIAIPFELTQPQFDALTSIIFNAGASGYRKSNLHQNFISKGIKSGPEFEKAFLSARTSDRLGGIDKRRERELLMFKGEYDKK